MADRLHGQADRARLRRRRGPVGRARTSTRRSATPAARIRVRIRSLKVPIDARALDAALSRRPALAQYAATTSSRDLGRDARPPSSCRRRDTALGRCSRPSSSRRRSAKPARRPTASSSCASVKPQQGGTARFLQGFYSGSARGRARRRRRGLRRVSRRRSRPSSARACRRSTTSTRRPAGSRSRSLLAGGATGNYGVERHARRRRPAARRPALTPTSG